MEEDNNLTLSILIKESGEYDELASSSDDESKGNNYTIDVMIKRIKSLSLTEMMKQLKYIGVYNYEFKSIEEFEALGDWFDHWHFEDGTWKRQRRDGSWDIDRKSRNYGNRNFKTLGIPTNYVRNFWNWKRKNGDPFQLGRSGDPIIDGFIFERKLRWIPYDEFKNIEYLDRGGFGTIYKAVWSDKGKEVILKRINNLNENLNEFLNECSHHEKCLWSSEIIFLFGFTKNPETSEYIIVIDYANKGSLRGNLTRIVKYSWKEKLLMLYKTISGLCAMHGQDLVHCDFHDGNILYHSYGKNDEEEEYEEEYEKDVYICDLGLCQPVKSLLKKDDIFGVVPFMAPEVLRGKPCTTASDIYSFSMIMWEFTSGVPPFNDKAHDIQLSLSICKGERPEIIENTPQCYVDLMKKCWNEDPLKRPSASQVMHVFIQWILCPIYAVHEELKNNIMEFMNAPIENNNNLIIEFHPQACYTCRLLEFTSSKVNEILESGNLDDCVINKPSDEDSNMPTAIDNAFDTENEELKKRIKADNSNDNQILKKIKIN